MFLKVESQYLHYFVCEEFFCIVSAISALFLDFLLSGSEKSFSLSFKSRFPKLRFFKMIVLFFELGG